MTDQEDNVVLDVQDLQTHFYTDDGVVKAVDGLNYKVRKGEFVALVGESGSGKSTLARSVLRLVEPVSGTVSLDGTELTTLSPSELRKMRTKMQIVFQDPYASMNPRRRIFDQIADPVRIHDTPDEVELRARLETLIREVDLPADSLERFPHEFSGGQRQRLCIARAMSLTPALIVADEPVSALDVSIQAQVVDLLLELQERQGVSYLFISHDMAVVERVAHCVAVMRQGRVVEIGPRRAVMENPQHPYTRHLLEAVPVADPSLRAERRQRTVTHALQSLVHPLGTAPRPPNYFEASHGHLVEQSADE